MIVEVILPIFALLVAGFLAESLGILPPSLVNILNKGAFYVALPALVFHSVYSRSLGEIYSPVILLVFCSIIFLVLVVSFLVFREMDGRERWSTLLVQTYHGNLGYMGLPIVTFAFGEMAGAKASFLLGFVSPVQISLTVILLVYLNQTEADIREQLKQILINPVLILLFTGILFSYFGLSLPTLPDRIISYIGEAALPMALLGVGAKIRIGGYRDDLRAISSVTVMKLVVMPLLGLIFLNLLGVDLLSLRAGILMLAMPTAISTFIYTSELGGDPKLASLNISFSTLTSLFTISVFLIILS